MTDLTVDAPVEQAPAPVSPPGSGGAPGASSDPFADMDSVFDEIAKEGNTTLFPDGQPPNTEDDEQEASEQDENEITDQSQTEEVELQDEEKAQSPKPGAIDRPTSWSPELDGVWKSLPPEAQQLVAKREGEAHAQITRMGETLSAYKPIGELLNQYRPVFERNRIQPAEGIRLLLDGQRMLDADPVGGLAAIADRYGMNRVQLAQALVGPMRAGADGKGTAVDPAVAQLSSQLASLNSRLDQREQQDRQRQEQQEKLAQETTDREVQAWATDTKAPKPFFNEVRHTMATMMTDAAMQGRTLSLDDAYDQACYANPAVREKVLAAKKVEDLEKRKREASAIKRQGALNAGAAAPARPAPGSDPLAFDALGEAYDAIAARA